jgi:hypothetical protein
MEHTEHEGHADTNETPGDTKGEARAPALRARVPTDPPPV